MVLHCPICNPQRMSLGETESQRELAFDKASRFSQIAPKGWMIH
jgi:hypothetical protein